MSCRSVFCCLSNNYMISFKSSKYNHFSKSVWFWNQKNLFLYLFLPASFLQIMLSYLLRSLSKKDLRSWLSWIHHYQSTTRLLHALRQNTCTSSWSLAAPFSSFCFTCFCYCFSFSSSVLWFPEYLLSSDGQIFIFTYQTVQKDFTGCSSSLAHFFLYQHDGDTFFLLNTSSIDKYNMPLWKSKINFL